MDKICKYGKIHGNTSPLCGNWDMYSKLKGISKEIGVSFSLLVGITYSESHIGANYSNNKCKGYNNWSGIKREKKKDGSIKKTKLPDENGCRLYKFNTIEDYWKSFSYTIKFGYLDKMCNTPECISKYYVGSNGQIKTRRSNRVNMFFKKTL